MRLHKFFDAGAMCPITGMKWPTQAWVARSSELDPSGLGFVVCRDRDLAHWAAPELYRVEIDGEIREEEDAVIAERVRLVELRSEWSTMLPELAQLALDRARSIDSDRARVKEYVGDCEMCMQYGMLPAALFVSAVACADAADPDRSDPVIRREAFLRERAWQSAWIAQRLE